jgi:hypothetical protein
MNNLTLDERPYAYIAEAQATTVTETTDIETTDATTKEPINVHEQIESVRRVILDINVYRTIQPMVELYNVEVSLEEALIDLIKIQSKFLKTINK